MKQTILIITIIITILLLPTVLGTIGGDTWTYNFPYCNELKVNITASLAIDDGEYTVNNINCTEAYVNYFECDCSNNYYFNISFATNAFNTYNLSFNYNYSKEAPVEEEEDDSGSSGSSGGRGGGGRVITGLTKGSKTTTLNYGDLFSFYIGNNKHRIIILKVTSNEIKIRIYSRSIELIMKEGETREVDVDDDGIDDFRVELKEIKRIGGLFTFTIIDEVVAVEEKEPEPVINKTTTETKIISETIIDDGVEPVVVKEPKFLIKTLVILAISIVGVIIYFVVFNLVAKKRKEEELKK